MSIGNIVLNAVITLMITLIVTWVVTTHGVNLTIQKTQDNNEEQEKLVVLKLLEAAETELNVTIENVDRIGNAQFSADDSKGCVIRFGSDPNDTLPYPTIFMDVITDKRVVLNLSKTNLLAFYSSEKALDKYRYAIMHPNNLLDEISYANYREELKFLQLALHEEIKSQEDELSEETKLQEDKLKEDKLSEGQVVKANKSFRSEAQENSPFENPFDFNNGRQSGCLPKQ